MKTSNNNHPKLMNIEEVAAQTGHGKSTIWKKILEKTFPSPIRISSRMTRWHSQDIFDYIESLRGVDIHNKTRVEI